MLESYNNKNNLLDINWYLSKMSMFLKESYGIVEEIKYNVDLLNNINEVCDSIMYSFDIYSKFFPKITDSEGNVLKEIDSYEDLMKSIDEENKGKSEEEQILFMPLDIIASLVGINRTIKLPNDTGYGWITLNNYELWQYILITIAKNNFNGTYEEIENVYERAHLNVKYVTDQANMTCNICIKDDGSLTSNIKNLLQNGNALINSMGVVYKIMFYREDNEGFKLDTNNNLDNFSYILR